MKKLLIFILSISLYGCKDYSSVSNTLFVNTIAIDYNKLENEFIIYYHMTNPSSLTTASLGGSGNGSTFSIAHGKGKTIFEAMEMIANNSNKKIRLTHIQTVIFTTSFFNYENINNFHHFIKTSNDIYSDFYILVTISEIEDIFRISDIEDNSPYYSIIASSNDANESHKMTSYLDFSRGITEKYKKISFPVLKCNDDIWETQKEKINSLDIIGDIYINKENEISFYKSKDYLITNILNTKANREISINDISYNIINNNFKIIAQKNNTYKLVFNIKAYITKFNHHQQNDEKKIFINAMSESLDNYINDTKENNIDIFEINDLLYRKGKLKSAFDYKDAKFIYEFKVNLFSIV